MPDAIRIALVVSWNLAYCRAVLRGVRQFAAERPRWVLTPLDPQAGPKAAIRALRPAGVIAHVYEPRLAAALVRWGGPVVNVSGVLTAPQLPRVGIDDDAVGRAAAEHLLASGLRQFAFAGVPAHADSRGREAGFRSALKQRGHAVISYAARGDRQFDPQGRPWALDPHLLTWIRSLPRPIGLFACNDLWGVQLTEACRQCGVRVPEDVAILGVDNDDLLCGLARPTLSSVAVPGERIGREAARRLERLMRRSPRESVPPAVLLPPRGVVVRQSSDLIASADADVAAAIRMIRDERRPATRVADILEAVPVGRRSLERRFQKVIGRGIWQEIRRTRIDRACRLLEDTHLAMPDVATRAGFTSARQLSLVFRQALKTTPTAYRRSAAAR